EGPAPAGPSSCARTSAMVSARPPLPRAAVRCDSPQERTVSPTRGPGPACRCRASLRHVAAEGAGTAPVVRAPERLRAGRDRRPLKEAMRPFAKSAAGLAAASLLIPLLASSPAMAAESTPVYLGENTAAAQKALPLNDLAVAGGEVYST